MLVSDDFGLFRRRLIVGLEAEPDVEVLAESDDGAASIELARRLLPLSLIHI